ncbi:outer membrane lipoprotein carrier protein LolA [Mucilaginibacter robiniae]|uniref:Outer membrane lipoprotein carrier protein LolA n=1 Tax=Mucilaginibacter robiniae TaxID=2728022 RepID=A0A7L5DW73_9SPHI|nr:outer membrane lipoprotein carrier protein LolA [Mucilaginibacter robiniae]QJD94488.1 outer membrane lipoprotein carrier protein LolA [Mucilaginibacter robiniae]
MKKIFTYLLLTVSASAAFAQKDKQAKTILDEVSHKYQAYDAVKTDFSVAVQNPQAGVNETQAGTLLARTKANQYRLTIFSPGGSKAAPAQEIISDGKTQWTYTPKDKEVQVNDASGHADAMNPSQLFNLYQKGYKYIYTGEQKVAGKALQVVELTPTDEKQSIFKIRLLIDKVKKQIYSALLFDKNGNRYTYTIRSFTPNASVAGSTFTYNPKEHPGVEVVDLR